MQSAQKTRSQQTALWFYVLHLGVEGWAAPVRLRDGVWLSPLCVPELSVDSAPTPAVGTCRRRRNDKHAHLCVWLLCVGTEKCWDSLLDTRNQLYKDTHGLEIKLKLTIKLACEHWEGSKNNKNKKESNIEEIMQSLFSLLDHRKNNRSWINTNKRQTHMSTQHCGLTAPVESTTVYLFGAVHSTERKFKKIEV